MKITFLGTGTSQGIPVIGSTHPVCLSQDKKDKRLRVSVLVEWNDYSYVIDCGPDFRYQMLRSKCNKIDGILFTHEHSDHVAGLDDIRPFVFRQGDLPIYGHKRVLEAIRTRFAYVFETENKYPGAPSVHEIEIKNAPFQLGDIKVIPIDVNHNYVQVFGFRFKDFAYITDAKTISDEEIKKLKELKVLVINALRQKPHHSHFNLEEALNFIDLVKPERAYLTHISHHLGFHEEVQQSLPNNVFLAYDNLEITI
ncbi:MAG: MBL fold metallo-hydrolase [Bacteroidia bacterium]|nr:MBL fold metallo-hydrolase [Bacteroidia bacterium]MBT8277946.1 MBL fold metallo-hydrolase [Bacteroidia bacterium]NND24523.1 MBL fold metallo-hydrolase [Flavobacteriaceae bacterium]NNK60190.1 MBL fold metallo-hydrolase [Flavobacteriaceae bacterium]RZW44466.1 MAG: MBL fold metallo-hydrolase [Flavobacteriaceae bacterium]